jgi:hypothetical protein
MSRRSRFYGCTYVYYDPVPRQNDEAVDSRNRNLQFRQPRHPAPSSGVAYDLAGWGDAMRSERR